jgi:hypothetical protein
MMALAEVARKAFRSHLADVSVYREFVEAGVRPLRVWTRVAPKRNADTQDIGYSSSQNYKR